MSQDAESAGGIHIRNEMQPEEFRINGIPLPTGLSYFGQGLSPRFANSFTLITGALPAQYGLSTTGIIDIQTKSGLFAPGGFVSMYGGGYDTLQPSAEYGGSIDGYNYYVSGDFLSTNHGIDGVTPAVTQIHDQSEQLHAFAYLDKIIDGENRVTAIAGLFNGRFEIPNNPATPTFPGITFLNGIPVSAFNPALLDERQNETSQFGVLSYLHSGPDVDFRISAFTKYSTLHFRRDPTLSDIAFNGISQNALLKSFANGMQVDAVGKIAADHTLRSGLFVSGERFTSQTVSAVLVQDGTDEFGNPTFGSTPGNLVPERDLCQHRQDRLGLQRLAAGRVEGHAGSDRQLWGPVRRRQPIRRRQPGQSAPQFGMAGYPDDGLPRRLRALVHAAAIPAGTGGKSGRAQ